MTDLLLGILIGIVLSSVVWFSTHRIILTKLKQSYFQLLQKARNIKYSEGYVQVRILKEIEDEYYAQMKQIDFSIPKANKNTY